MAQSWEEMPQVTLEQAQAAKRTAVRLLETVDCVVGVGITRLDGEYAVKVNLSGPVGPGTKLPTEIDGVAVRVEVTGTIRAR
jgi:hypothetical protein